MTWRASFRIWTSTSNASRFRRMTEEGLTHPVIARLADALTARAAACREILRHASSCQHVLPQRHQHRKDAPVKEQRILSAAGDRLARALRINSVPAGPGHAQWALQ